jgi:phosphate transport system permease protein
VTSIIAMLIAVPFSIGSAVLLSDLAPYRIRRPLRVVVDLMAGVPSIIFGMWGLFILAPFMSSHIQPLLAGWFGYIPVLSTLFSGPPIGIGLLTAGIVLALMVIPIMTSMMTDLFATTPQVLKEAAYGTGATSWEVVNKVLIPYTRSGLIGTIMLGLGRALGETMAITFVIGNAPRISAMLFDPGTTISSAIANEFAEATGTLYPAALMELGLLLFVITFGIIICSRWILSRYSRVKA